MAQFGRPSSDITASGWSPSSGSTLWEVLDDNSDTDYITCTGDADVFEVKLTAVTDPVSSADHIVRISARATGSGGPERLNTWGLYQGTTEIVTSNTAITRSSFNTYEIALNGTQADSITDYSDLRIRGTSNQGATEVIDVGWCEFQVPDAPSEPIVLTAESGTFTLTGQAVNLLTSRLLSADAGSFSLTGQDAGLYHNRVVIANFGSFALSGQDAGLYHNRYIGADAGVFTLTGNNADLVYSGDTGPTLVAEAGVFSVTGNDVNLKVNRVIKPLSGSFNVVGGDVNLVTNRLLSAGGGIFNVAGQNARLARIYKIVASTGAYNVDGQPVTFIVARELSAEGGQFVYTGNNVNLIYSGDEQDSFTTGSMIIAISIN